MANKETGETREVPESVVVTPDPAGISDRVLVGTFATPAPSDAAHDALKGPYEDVTGDTEATDVARAAAFDLGVGSQVEETGPRSPDKDESEARSAHLDSVREDRKAKPAGPAADTSGDGAGGLTAGDFAAVQSPAEATAEEEKRREDFTPTELEEAETRDAIVREGDVIEDAGVPNVGTEPDAPASDSEASDKADKRDKDKS